MKASKLLISLIVLACCCIQAAADGYEYGLKIVTYPSPGEEFTGVALDNGKLIPSKNSTITMNFEMLNRRDNVFGCIFRIISDKGHNIDLMYTADRKDNRYPILVCDDKVTAIPSEIPFDEWIPVSISLDTKTGRINLTYNGIGVSVSDEGTSDASGFRISFGTCQFAGYVLEDVASISLREISIHRGTKLLRHWTLSLHDEDQCLDEVKKSPAFVKNPSWIIDSYVTWNQTLSLNFDEGPSLAIDENDNLIVTTDGTWTETYDLSTGIGKKVEGISGICPINAPNQLMYTGGDLFAYNVDKPSFARYESKSNSWTDSDNSVPESSYWNKTSSWWAADSALVSFGGYGFYHYNNDLLIQHPYGNKPDIKLIINDIHPRFSCASTIIDDTLYIFGGRGNVSGKQELSPRDYYDFYAIDLKTHDINKLWEFEQNPEMDFMPAGNMVYDSERERFYVFTNLDQGSLISISKDKPGYELMSLPCGVLHAAQYKDMTLWRSADGSKLYGLIILSQIDGNSTVNIMEMNYPPINVESLRQSIAEETLTKKADNTWLHVILAACVLLAAAAGFIFGKRARKKKISSISNSRSGEEKAPFYNFDKGSICFFGGFCVKDKDGNDITSKFTPTLKALATLLLLHTAKEPSGIISNKLNRILWPYKPEDTANNNRNVYISKLRPILEEIGDIKITCQNRFWSMQLGDGVICDYMEVQRLLGEESSAENIDHLLELLLRGMMLPNMEQDWVGEFKSDFSTTTIDFLSRQLKREDLPEEVLINACDTIFQHDCLNEEALFTKCKTLYRHGKAGLAKNTYDSFCKDYKKSIGMDFEAPFKKIIE